MAFPAPAADGDAPGEKGAGGEGEAQSPGDNDPSQVLCGQAAPQLPSCARDVGPEKAGLPLNPGKSRWAGGGSAAWGRERRIMGIQKVSYEKTLGTILLPAGAIIKLSLCAF